MSLGDPNEPRGEDMKIYRGPRTKDFSDDSHELVDTKNLAEISPWHASIRVAVNLSKEPLDRQAIGHIEFEPEDVLSLLATLIEGLRQRSAELDQAQELLGSFRSAILDIRFEASQDDPGRLKKIHEIADAAFKLSP